ncbi:peptidyl-prolyl cis-trans isomerase [Anaeromyxobacter dehalogenans]|uniref:Periplasmic chaperone PpiD n=1 Tax=Anaeromyxobacter dehalogenans (strain 2CP-C) TaxID=290397 RepID=Q2IE28_ANADE|nr:peptidyl-prolyl cis-trans isomerase [Anaeromyxobacter dehalogenans]ABC82838.1 PpiC-type peptidyl-prolyl cis-trans isomerase [Anaeromyxobacter dehalogenans 2CP-C]
MTIPPVTSRSLLVAVLAFTAPRMIFAAEPSKPSGPGATAQPAKAAEPAAAAKPAPMTARIEAPLFSPLFARMPIARIDDQVVPLADLQEALASTHGERSAGAATAPDFKVVLQRIIDSRLLIMEAREMGLDELPELKEQLAVFKDVTLRETLQQQVTKDVKPDALEVERVYKESVRRWKVRSLLFQKEEDAAAVKPALAGGKSFVELAKQLVAEKKADGSGEPEVLPPDQILPAVAAALQPLHKGEVTAPLKLQNGFAILYVEDLVYPDDPAKRAEAEAASIDRQGGQILIAFRKELDRKYVKIDEALLRKIDFDAPKPGFAVLVKDKRPIARIAGEAPITVSDLANAVGEKFFHGVEKPQQEKRVDKLKRPRLDGLIYKRVFTKEARVRKLDQSEEYLRAVADQENSLVFGTFVQRVLVPDVSIKDADLRAYYDGHRDEFTAAPLYRLDQLAFPDMKGAQRAAERLARGTDFKWLKANAEGQLAPAQRALDFEGQLLSAKGLPEDLAGALASAQVGDYRMHQGPRGQGYVVLVVSRTDPQVQPYEEARKDIQKKLFGQALNRAVTDWAAKLRAAHDIETFITRIGN